MKYLSYTVPKEENGDYVRDIIHRHFDISKRMLKRCKQDNEGILVNNKRCTVRYIVQTGDVISLYLEPKEKESDIQHEDAPLSICYEDESVLVVDKPPHMMMYPRFKGEKGSLAGRVLYHLDQNGEIAIYHPLTRLDIGTSGLVLLAKNSYATHRLNIYRPQKYYQCFAYGQITKSLTLTSPLAEVSTNIRKLTGALQCVHPGGKISYTHIMPLFFSEQLYATGLWVQIETGRRHQIRVHLAHQGHPIMGDVAYGGPAISEKRPLLHAAALSYLHPVTGKRMRHFLPIHNYGSKLSVEINNKMFLQNFSE